MTYLIVTGPSGSGKSTLADELAVVLQWPYLAKDQLKESLANGLGTGSAAWSHRLSDAALDLVFLVARTCPNALIEANLRADEDLGRVAELIGSTLQIFCTAPTDVLVERVTRRLATGERHPVHLDAQAGGDLEDEVRRQAELVRPLPIAGALLCVDTSEPVDTGSIASWVWSQVTESYARLGERPQPGGAPAARTAVGVPAAVPRAAVGTTGASGATQRVGTAMRGAAHG